MLTGVAEMPAETSPPTLPPPPTTFTYQQRLPGDARMAPVSTPPFSATPGTRAVSVSGLGGTTTGFLDIDGDGLPDFLDGLGQTNPGGMALYRNRWGGTVWFEKDPSTTVWSSALEDESGNSWMVSPSVRLIDMDGDGLPDVLRPSDACSSPPPPSGTCTWNFSRNLGDPHQRQGALQIPLTPGAWQGAPSNTAIVSGDSSLLIDLNGDGLPDALDCHAWSAPSNQFCALYRNLGTGADPDSGSFAATVSWAVPPANDCTTCGFSIGALATTSSGGVTKQVLDLNGDGLPDLVSSRPASSSRACLGGSNPGAACTTGTQCSSGVCAGHWDVWLNTGSGFRATPETWPAPPFNGVPYALQVNDAGGVKQALRDMNGDGLPDYVDATSSPWTVYTNTGAGFSSPGVAWVDTSGLGSYLSGTNGAGLVTADVFDANGDGIADYVVSRSSGPPFDMYLGVRPRGGLLVKEENGLGASYEVAYVPSTDPAMAGAGCAAGSHAGAPCMSNAECPGSTCASPCPGCSQLPFPTWVVATLTEHSGFSSEVTTQFTFTGGYFDPGGHQFRGFRQSLETRVPGASDARTIRRQFAAPPFATSTSPPWPASLPARPFKLIDEQVLDNAGKPLTEVMTDWGTTTLSGSGGRVQVHPTKRIDTTYSTAAGVTKKKMLTRDLGYDIFNNVASEVTTGATVDGGSTIPDFNAITTTATYAAAAPCRGQPTRVLVASGGTDLSEKDFGYDSRCNLTAVQARLAPSGQPLSSGTLITTTTLVYDQSAASPDAAAAKTGQPTRILDARGNATTLQYGAGAGGAGSGCTAALFPCTITNALGQTTLKSYDLQWGKPLSVTDANGAQTTFAYDGLGRLTAVTRPLDTSPWQKFMYTFLTNQPAALRIDTAMREPNSADAYRLVAAFYDSVGRAVESKEKQYVDGTGTVVVRAAVAFDSAGRVGRQCAPYTAPTQELTTYHAPPAGTPGTLFLYDALDRVTDTINPDGTYRRADYTVAGETTALDENYNECAHRTGKAASCPGAKTVEKRDALARVIRKAVFNGATLITQTNTVYDGLGRVTSTATTDMTKTATTRFDYDSFGRRTGLTDPDSEAWTYLYDNAGNLVFQNDPATNRHLEFCYDALNRLTRKLYLDGDTLSPFPDTLCTLSSPTGIPYLQYTYDSGAYATGRLSTVDDYQSQNGATLSTAFTYDARGRVASETLQRSIPVGGVTYTGNYRRTYRYDVADRLVRLTYPTNAGGTDEWLSYTYTDLGQLQAAYTDGQTYADMLTYDRFGRLTRWRDGSGLNHRAAYDLTGASNFRLTQLKVDDGTSVLQEFDYVGNGAAGYDVGGNLLQLKDNTGTYTTNSTLRNTWAYQYDGLGRLTGATPPANGEWGSSETFTYDGLGNITTKSATVMAYAEAAHPHHITSLTPGGAVDYERDGGMAALPATSTTVARTMTYDADGRLTQVTTGDGHVIRSLYDFRGERVARIVDENLATFFFGRWFEVTGSSLTRHMYLGDRLIAESPIAAPGGLASLPEAERAIELARAMRAAVATRPMLYPIVPLTSAGAAAVGGTLMLLCVGLGFLPGRVRVAYLGRVQRGPIALLIVVFVLGLTPLPLARPAHAGTTCTTCPPQPPPVFPVYFVHTDHLGSTVMLTCYNQGSCSDRSIIRYYRYDAYGRTKAYSAGGAALASLGELLPDGSRPERLYTGQRWDWQAQLYDYGARFYDPRVANFVTEDPVREYMNPYAYVAWNPVQFSDPTGMYGALWGTALGFTSLGYFGDDSGKWAAAAATQITGSSSVGANFGGPAGAVNGVFAGGGFGSAGGWLPAGVAAVISSLIWDFDQSFMIGGVRVGGIEAGVPGSVDARVSFTASPFTLGAVIPHNLPGLVTALLNLPNNLVQWTLGFLAGGLQSPVLVNSPFGGSAFFFGGNPKGYETSGSTIFGPSSDRADFASGKAFPFYSPTGQYLAHEFGHLSQSAILGPAFYPTWFGGSAWAFALGGSVLTANFLEAGFLNGAPTASILQTLR